MASSSSSFCSTTPKQNYQVFLSFSGKDTRKKFTSHLYAALLRSKIKTFMDDPELRKGDRISPSLRSAIEESMISVVIFSKRYASSRWCLDELVYILQCKDKYGQIVIPVFYHVEPAHVRYQTGAFADGFAKLEKRCKDSLETYKHALKEAASISGFDSEDTSFVRSEALLIEKIVDDILKKLNSQSPPVDDEKLVGVDLRAEDIKRKLCIESGGVRKLGIWGSGGIGKTTLAESVFKRISKYFESSYFIQNIREESERGRLREMGRELISTILEDRHPTIGCIFTKNRLSCKKVFIVFDDVTDFQQIRSLIGNLEYLGAGSRIIITTRDKYVLKNCEVDEIYEAQALSYDDSLQLFSQYALGRNCPKKNYVELSTKVVKYAGGIPLALKTLGSFLFDRTEQEWHSTIDKLGKVLPAGILKVLKISYDGLDKEEKEMFLDIAYFYKSKNINEVKKIFDSSGFSSEIGIQSLIEKSLITISFDCIQMHDLLQEMGRAVVQESTNNLGKRSRLCNHDEIYRVLTENMGTEEILGIHLDVSKIEEIHLNHNVFTNMRNLRSLILYKSSCTNKVHGFEGIESNFRELRYLFVEGYPAKSLPSNFYFRNLVELHLPTSNIEELRLGNQSLDNLKHLDLSWSKHLLKISDLSLAPNLEQLVLGNCPRLQEISSSDLHLNKLVYLNLHSCCSFNSLPIISLSKSLTKIYFCGCSWLESLPNGICELESLTCLDLSCCSRLESLPNGIHKLKSLTTLSLYCCSRLESLPNGICKLESLIYLNLSYCSRFESLPNGIRKLKSLIFLDLSSCSRLEGLPNGICKLASLTDLNLSHCSQLDNWLEQLETGQSFLELPSVRLRTLDLNGCCITELHYNLGQLSSIRQLYLGGNNFESLPASIKNLTCLETLNLSNCERLRSLPELPLSLRKLEAQGCTSLEEEPSVLFNFLRLTNNLAGDFINRRNFSPLDPRRFCFPGSEIPKWFNFQSTGSSLRLPPGWCDDNFSGFAVGVVVSFSDCKGEGFGLRLACDLIVDHEPIQMHTWISWSRTDIDYIKSDHVLLEYNVKIATVISGARSKFDNKKASIKFYFVDHKENEVLHGCRIKKCGVHLFTDRFVPIEMKRSWCPLGQNKRKRSSCPGGQNKRKRLLCPGRAAIPLTRALLLRAMVASRRNKRSKAQ